MRKIVSGLVVLLFCLFSLLVVAPAEARGYTEEEKLLLQSWRLVNEAYIDDSFNHQNWWFVRQKFLQRPLHNKEEAYQAISEMLATLNDPYTRFFPPEQYKSLQISTSGELSGVGLQISINPENNQLEVVSPLPNSPAELAGIQPHDQILSIDGIPANTLTLDEAASRIRGEEGTVVILEIKSQKDGQLRHYKLRRQRLSLSPVFARLDTTYPEYPIGYIRLTQFTSKATEEIAHSIVKLEEEGAKAYVLDLRNNPGGLLQAGVDIASLFLPEGTIVYTVNRQGVLGSYESDGHPVTLAPLVVLVNGGTASASEILAGALQDNHRAVLVGEKTFGKGLIQSLFQLPDGAGLTITVAKYETPSHRDINKQGIMPDIEVKLDHPITPFEVGTAKDYQYQAAVAYLLQQYQGMPLMASNPLD
ncbi:MAG: S41 family peptidase [Geminocystis sp.]|nr:S41 family peptidase [Geminocystis sp.]MCS7147945.1 S41 family peptidase [Geminocystis sp.]MDW8116860.1 S41 family peptidase [Geminocystis sp.]MDW8462494.1 S41 family peptidase [Geminocystis sp.]